MGSKYDTSLKGRYRSGKFKAKKRNVDWDLTLEEYSDLVRSGECHYCKGTLSKTGYSLDRVDNSKSYTLDNCVPCCRHCNMIKGDSLSYKEARVAISAIVAMREADNEDKD